MSLGREDDDMNEAPSLYDVYNDYFEVIPVDTPALLEEAYRLRYQVYCVENEYIDTTNLPNEQEIDEFDGHCEHSLLIHRSSGTIAGVVRLVLPDHTGRKSLPAALASQSLFEHSVEELPLQSTAEISRFCVSKEFRRRLEDDRWPAVHSESSSGPNANRRILPHITLGLMHAILQMSLKHDITHWCACVETPLLRLLKRLGISFRSAGPLVSHHGWRQPVYISLAELNVKIYSSHPEVWDVITAKGQFWERPVLDDQDEISVAG